MSPSWKRIGAYLGILGGIIFVVVTFIAMLTYPGGYSFLENSFSALGQTVINSIPSMLNYFLFVTACTGAAVCLVPFLFAMRTLFTETTGLKALSWLGTLLCLGAAPNLSALAIFAGNVFPDIHGNTTRLFFILIMLGILCYSIAILMKSEYENIYALIGLIVVVICVLHIVAMFGIASDLFGTALWQKVAVYGLVLWSVFQGYKLLKVFEQ
ncbi:MAG: hypothetical protein AM325_000555 [Candidatus Thorarchaeota archaeon SMTZ1-45]|nr:MAG: hypothetical protein AM325_00570 [Candidatus Thorarchaeota archaeon SMTZ1-45]